MSNPIVTKIANLWEEHIHDVFMFPSDETLRDFFRRQGYSDDAISEALDSWWSDDYLTGPL